MTTPVRPTRRRHRLLAVAATLALGLGLVPLTAAPALACSCVGGTDAEHANRADVVFIGRVDDVWTARPFLSSADPKVATIVVDEVYKGDVHTYTDITTASSGASCGIKLVVGRTMLVFASYGGDGIVEVAPDELHASLCSGTRRAELVPTTLVAGHAPIAGRAESGDAGFPLLGWVSFGAVAGLGAMPLMLWARLRKR